MLTMTRFGNVKDRINELKLTTPKFMKDFYEITSDKELEDLKKCLLKELQEEELQEEKRYDQIRKE